MFPNIDWISWTIPHEDKLMGDLWNALKVTMLHPSVSQSMAVTVNVDESIKSLF